MKLVDITKENPCAHWLAKTFPLERFLLARRKVEAAIAE